MLPSTEPGERERRCRGDCRERPPPLHGEREGAEARELCGRVSIDDSDRFVRERIPAYKRRHESWEKRWAELPELVALLDTKLQLQHQLLPRSIGELSRVQCTRRMQRIDHVRHTGASYLLDQQRRK
jgi:hypothetical protein